MSKGLSKLKYKIAFISCEPWERDFLSVQFPGHEVAFFSQVENKDEINQLAAYDIISCFIYSHLSAKVIKQLPNVRYITTRSTGYDHIDVAAACKWGIKVSNVPLYGANTVAEHTFALILSLSRKIYDAIDRTKKSDFDLSGLRGFDVQGKVIGIVGTGHIGAHVARIAHGFGMNIIAYDVVKDKKIITKYRVKYVSFSSLLKQADIITLHAPYNKKTHHLINSKNIASIKKGAYLINTARGGLIETKALVQALTNGQLAGAGLDVLEEEGLIKEEVQMLDRAMSRQILSTMLQDHILLKMDNVVVTPHNAFNSQEALQRILDTTVENIHSYIERRPRNVVN